MTNEIEIIESEVSLENEITSELIKYNVTDAIIAGLKEKFLPLVQRGKIQNKEEFSEVVDARKECKGWRVTTTKVCKKGREKAVKVQKGWIAKEGEVIAKIAEVEDPLAELEDEWTTEQERIKLEKKRMQEEQLATRQQDLAKMGVLFTNGSYELGDVSYEYALVKESDDDTYQTIFNAFKAVYDTNEAYRVEKLRKEQEAAAELQRQKDELLRQQNELKEQQAEIQRQKEQHQKKIDDERKQVIRNRSMQLESLGMKFSFQYNAYVFQDVNVDNPTEICLFDEKEWNDLIEKIKPVIEERKAELSKKEQEKINADIENAKLEAIKKEQERQAEEQRLTEIKRKEEEAKKAEELAQASDKVKYADLIKQFNAIKFPDMRSGQYRKKVAVIREKMEEINSL